MALERYTGVAVLFAVCGALSSFLFPGRGRVWEPLLPLPFALLCVILFLRKPRAILAVAFSVPVYGAAVLSAVLVSPFLGWACFPPVCLGGFVGGAGLAFSFGIVHQRLLARRCLLRVASIGAVAALPFALWVAYLLRISGPEDPQQALRLMCSYAIWQAVVGTYLYAICTRPADGGRLDDLTERHSA
ncbi:MAG TPA: hypothetical protein VN893_26685 [Bryobacteraceae bacterium]|nr:hypothetical protein [Bryobacteraceae bacterium]